MPWSAEQVHRGGVREDFAATTSNSVNTRRWAHNQKVIYQKDLVSEKWWRTGNYATLCLVKGDKGQWVVMVVVGSSGFCLLAVLGPSCCPPALDWSLLVLVVLVDHSGVPVLTGHIFCKWYFPIYVHQHQCLLLCYPPVALLAFTYLKILWVV